MRWATRSGVHVDRAACAWLVKRHVDASAEFVFVDDPDDVPSDATPFDEEDVVTPISRSNCLAEMPHGVLAMT